MPIADVISIELGAPDTAWGGVAPMHPRMLPSLRRPRVCCDSPAAAMDGHIVSAIPGGAPLQNAGG